MFENNNRAIMKELAREAFKSHRARNNVAVFSIFLATFLLTGVLTVGLSFLSTADYAMEQTPGPEADGYLTGGYEVFEKAEALPQVAWADYVRKCGAAALHNADFTGMEVRLFAPEDSFYRHNHIVLMSGVYPQGAQEILISDTLGRKLGLGIGDFYTLEVPLITHGKEVVQKLSMKICGIYKNPLFSLQDIYDEIYTSADFVAQHNPEGKEEDNIIYIKLAGLNPLLLKSDVGTGMYEICERTGAAGFSQGKNTAGFAVLFLSAVPFFLFLLLLMTSGYFLIYNVFYIAVTADIRWFGMMKTIGTTEKQIGRIMNRQLNWLAVMGILPGLCAGYLVSGRIAPEMMQLTDWGIYYKTPGFMKTALLASVFSWVTVRWSAGKSVRMAARISPVEAGKFTPKKKKYVFSVVSLCLGGILFLAVTNAVLGFDTGKYVDRYNQNDFRIFHKASMYALEEPFVPISQELVHSLEALPFVSRVDQVYMARTQDERDENGYFPDSRGEIRPVGKIWDYYCQELNPEQNRIFDYWTDRGNLRLGIAGLPPERLITETANYHIMEGELNPEIFSSGEYVIFNMENLQAVRNSYGISRSDGEAVSVRAGDRLRLIFYQEETDVYVEKELTVLAVIKHAFEYTSSDVREAALIIPDNIFREIYPNYENRISALEIAAKKGIGSEEAEQLQKVLRKEHSTQLMTESRFETEKLAQKSRLVYGMLGFLLVFTLTLIGVSNIANTVTAHVLAGKCEYAAMQAVGMTKKQLFFHLAAEGLRFCLPAYVLMVPGGWIMAEMIAGNTSFTGFDRPVFFMSLLAVLAVLLLLCVVLAAVLVRVLNRKTIVERLRESE